MASDDQGDERAPGSSGATILTRKTAGLPNWVWMAVGLLLALAYTMWQRNRQEAAAAMDETAPPPGAGNGGLLPGDQTPPPVFILPQNPVPTVPIDIDVIVPKPPAPPPTTPPTAPPTGGRPTTPTAPPKPAPPTKPAIVYDAVTVAKWKSSGTPWNSTLWGIAKNKGYGAASTNWSSIWNDPKNATLKAKRGKPEKIQPGDVIYVRRK